MATKTKELDLAQKLVVVLRQLTLSDGRLTCVYCGDLVTMGKSGRAKDIATIDHVIAQNVGGKDTAENLVVVCMGCNSSKQDRPLNDWLRNYKYSHLPGYVVDQIVATINKNITAITSQPVNESLRKSLATTRRIHGRTQARRSFADHLSVLFGDRIAI